MKESEAIKIIKEKACNNRCIPQLCNDGCMYDNTKCAFSMAIEALEKQIPMKVVKVGKWRYKCPCCSESAETDCGDNFYNYRLDYCNGCGQKLDWSDEVGVMKNERSRVYGRWSRLFRGRMSKTDL